MKRQIAAILALIATWPATGEAFTLFLNTRNDQAVLGWSTRRLEVDVSTLDCPLSKDDFYAMIDAAIKVWNQVPGSSLTLARGEELSISPTEALDSSRTRPVVVCDTGFSARLGVNGDYIPATTFIVTVEASTNRITHSAMLLNAEATKSASLQKVDRDLMTVVMAHEFGHMIGLAHSADTSSLMYYNATAKKRVSLAWDDIEGVTYLYPRFEPFNASPFGCATVSASKPRPPSGPGMWGFGLAITLLGLYWAWTKRSLRVGRLRA